jgi:hypothetical protein
VRLPMEQEQRWRAELMRTLEVMRDTDHLGKGATR